MADIFNPQDILKIAIKVKQNSRDLYTRLDEKNKDPKLKELWSYLKKEEEMHSKVFQEMLSSVMDYIMYEITPEEYDPYLRTIAPNYIYTQDLIEKKTQELFNSDLEAIEFGIYVKIESILAFYTLKKYMLPEKIDILNKIIGDEKRDMARLIFHKHQTARKPHTTS